MEYITIAQLSKPFGLKGEIRAFSMTSFPEERFRKGQKVYARKEGKETIPLTIERVRMQGDALILLFAECHSVEEVEGLKTYYLDMDKAEADIPEGYYRFADLIGCKAMDEEGNELGEVLSVTSYAPTKNLKIKKADGKSFYVPFLDQFVPTVDIEKKIIVIHVIEGML